ncbi:hypothetical protein PGQ11_008122 [Apiospora arundinis]|uniref:Flavin reductase like domain-containing protein n=1 Tax=Apiospora arundinis TaxID=335852 RepID=A0ABR2IE34_9PEZI
MHSVISPAIMYWGTPVVLITTENEDGTPNIAPMSSAWWLADRCVLGLASHSQTTINLMRTKQCVLNLPSDDMGSYVNAIAKTTGSPVIPPGKIRLGYAHCKNKFARSGLTPQASDLVRPPRISQCPVQMEAEVIGSTKLMQDAPNPDSKRFLLAIEVKVLRTHIESDLRLVGHSNRVDPDRWRPMIMSFQHLYGLAPEKLVDSTLASIDEEKYRTVTGTDQSKLGGNMDNVDTREVNGDAVTKD